MYWNSLMPFVDEYFQQDTDETLYVLCPFITTKLFEKLLDGQEEVVIVTSWRKDHLLAGVSDLALYEVVKKHPKWSLRINDRLHAKVFSRSFKDMIFGSANLTGKALNDDSKSNFEVMDYAHCTREDEEGILQIIDQSTLMNDEKFMQYSEWYEENKDKYPIPSQESVIEPEVWEKEFLISSLPASLSPRRIWEIMVEGREWNRSWDEKSAAVHDLEIFGLDHTQFETYELFHQEIKTKVLNHLFVDSFCKQIDTDGLYFGRAKQWIHETCVDDPVPYRKEITGYVQSLFSWLVELFPERYIVEVPNYSERIRLL